MSEIRDLRDVPFAQVETAILRDPTITPQCKGLYALLVSYGPERIFPGQKRLACELGTTRQTVSRWLHMLRELGLIAWQQREGTSNLYTILGCNASVRGCNASVTGGVTPVLQGVSHPVDRGCNASVTGSISTDQQPTDLDPVTMDDAPAGATTPVNLEGWQDSLRESKNRNATLTEMIATLYPHSVVPEFGYIGRVARNVGGAGRLAELLWKAVGGRPSGDLLRYVQAVARNNGRNTGPPQTDQQREDAEYLEELVNR